MRLIESINRQLYDIYIKAADDKVKNLGSYTAKVFGLKTAKKQQLNLYEKSEKIFGGYRNTY